MKKIKKNTKKKKQKTFKPSKRFIHFVKYIFDEVDSDPLFDRFKTTKTDNNN